MGISPVAVYSTVDREGLHVRLADEAILIGPPAARESYLKIDAIIDAAKKSGAEAIHPGYGFLSENPDFAEACEKAKIVFIGPPAAAIRAMGNKIGARNLMKAAGVPITPGTGMLPDDESEAVRLAAAVGFPLMIKAAAGGGGKGMRIVRAESDLRAAVQAARSEARTAFGDGSVYAERYVDRPRHIEVQVLADGHGNVIHLGERECSIQRRHQKVLEECPSPVVDAATRERIGAIAVQAARAVNYVGAGTVEMLRSDDGSFYFMEMNTRLQVEHPVTEMVTGIDLVRAQIEIAAGGKLPCSQEEVVLRGHAIECRVYAEDPSRGFLPSPGRIGRQRVPTGPFVRLDGCAYPGYDVPIQYDPMISKLATWGATRAEAADRMRRALDEYRIQGIRTTIPFHRRLVRHPAFLAADLDTHFIDRFKADLLSPAAVPAEIQEVALIAAAVSVARRNESLSASLASAPSSEWKRAGRRDGLRGSGPAGEVANS
jgi:acetyl-CoA carboxylase biotin carboxylase subunit